LTKKKQKKKRGGIPILGFIVGAVTVAVALGSTSKAGGEIEPDKPDNRIRDCINAGGTWNDQFQICEFKEMPPDNGLLFPVGTRVRVKPNCGNASGLTGRISKHVFQTSFDVRNKILSMQVDFDNPPPFRNGYRPSEDCLVIL